MRTSTILSLLAVPALTAGISLSSTEAQAAFTKVTPSTLKFEGVRYWRKKANEARLGAVGRKMSPAAGKNYFQKIQNAPDGIYKVSVGAHTTITTKQAQQWGMTAQVGNGGVSGKAKASGSGKYSGKLTAYKMVIDYGNRKGNLRYETNRAPAHLAAVKGEGNKARMISAVWVLVEGEEAKSECYSGELEVKGNGWAVSPSASGCSENSWTIQPGSVIAYEMVKIDKWDVQDGLTQRPTCSAGYTLKTRSSSVTPMDQCVKTEYETTTVECKLLPTDKAKNWYVKAKNGRDVCASRKGKKDKAVKCKKSGYDYVSQSGKDTCRKPVEKTRDPKCPGGFDYDKRSTGNGGKDQCKLNGIDSLKPDSHDGF
ncbi:MAG: hypothetical protein AAGA54_19210 [Myxococcota bacterium]